ncbi:unnamed protein product [Nezara viridula]|nr:unnamed protein product [Nezara viridula]
MVLLAWLAAGAVCLYYMILVARQPRGLPGLVEVWEHYKTVHGKNYSQKEDEERVGIFLESMKEIEYHNELFEMGLRSYKKQINKFSDYTPDELDGMKCFRGEVEISLPEDSFSFSEGASYPESFDWRSRGAVNRVKDQGQCGSCYAFSAIGSLEAQHFIKTGKLVSLSEQNIVDCSRPQGNYGCDGGYMISSFHYIFQNNGIDTELAYGYEALEGACRFQPSAVGATLRGYGTVASSEKSLQAAIIDIGPISVGIHVNNNFFAYGGAIFDDGSCDPNVINHAVLVVGFGSAGGQDYWIVKNSWSSLWGENGYMKIARNKGNMCGIASMASFPIV